MGAGDPQFEWRGPGGDTTEAPPNARTYVDIARARIGPFGRIVMSTSAPDRWKVEVATLKVPPVIANVSAVRTLPTDRRAEIIGAFRAEGLPVEPA
jgi:hypothetical protein